MLASANLAAAARVQGAGFRFRTTVITAAPLAAGGWRLGLADGDHVDAAVVVNAAGPWSSGLNRLAGVGAELTVGLRALRQEVHQVHAPPGYGDGADLLGPAVADMDLGTYLKPGPNGMLLIGGTEPECDPMEWLDDPDLADARVTRERWDAQTIRAARRLPGLGVPNRPTGIAGVYDVADDWTPIYDRTDAPGFYVAIGTSGNQFKNAPLVGRFLTAIVTAVESGHDHDADPVRYRGEHADNVIDLGAFSRKRQPNSLSSGTVMG